MGIGGTAVGGHPLLLGAAGGGAALGAETRILTDPRTSAPGPVMVVGESKHLSLVNNDAARLVLTSFPDSGGMTSSEGLPSAGKAQVISLVC